MTIADEVSFRTTLVRRVGFRSGLFCSLWYWRLWRRVGRLLLLLNLFLLLPVRRDIGPKHECSSRLLKGRCLHVQLVGKSR